MATHTNEFSQWRRTSRSGMTRTIGVDRVDNLLNSDAVGQTVLIQFSVDHKETNEKSFEWYDCIIVYGDDASLGIIGVDGKPFCWNRKTLEDDLADGVFKEWLR